MKRILLIMSVLGFISCTESNVEKENTKLFPLQGYSDLKIIKIDNCEYLLGEWGNATVLTHKGNCKNCNL